MTSLNQRQQAQREGVVRKEANVNLMTVSPASHCAMAEVAPRAIVRERAVVSKSFMLSSIIRLAASLDFSFKARCAFRD